MRPVPIWGSSFCLQMSVMVELKSCQNGSTLVWFLRLFCSSFRRRILSASSSMFVVNFFLFKLSMMRLTAWFLRGGCVDRMCMGDSLVERNPRLVSCCPWEWILSWGYGYAVLAPPMVPSSSVFEICFSLLSIGC